MSVEAELPETMTFAVFYTEPIVREAVRQYVVRRILRKWELWAIVALAIGWAIYLRQNGQLFWAGILAGVAVLPVAMMIVAWRAHWVNTVGKFRRMRSPEATFVFGAETLVIRSSEGEATIPIANIKEIWKFEDFWMLFLAPNSFMTLPVAQLDGNAIAILNLRLSGAKQGVESYGG